MRVTPRVETFELSILGGATEHRYRAQCPQIEKMPWGTLDLSEFSEVELEMARQGWTDLAIQEYGAAASQGNALRLLVRARAPIDLSAWLTNFPLDELVHTELCARMAVELGGVPPMTYPTQRVFPSPSLSNGSPLLDAARVAVWEFCVGETVSHGQLAFHRRNARHLLLKALWGRLAKDEAAHARFGWVFLEWAYPRLNAAERAEVAETFGKAVARLGELEARVRASPEEAFASVGVFGARGRAAYLTETRDLLEQQVVRRFRTFM